MEWHEFGKPPLPENQGLTLLILTARVAGGHESLATKSGPPCLFDLAGQSPGRATALIHDELQHLSEEGWQCVPLPFSH